MRRCPFLFLLIFSFALSLSGCPGVFGPPPKIEIKRDFAREAKSAFDAGKYIKSRELYAACLRESNLSPQERSKIHQLHVKSALLSKDLKSSFYALEWWKKESPGVATTWEWNRSYAEALRMEGGDAKVKPYLTRLTKRNNPWPLRSKAGMALIKIDLDTVKSAEALNLSRQLHKQAAAGPARSTFEMDMARVLSELSAKTLDGVGKLVDESNRMFFPYVNVSFERTRRQAEANPSYLSKAREFARRLAEKSDLADRELFLRILDTGIPPEESMEDSLPPAAAIDTVGGPRSAVILPLGGDFKGISERIIRGIDAARALMTKDGKSFDVQVINSDSPDFTQEIIQLSKDVVTIGGPLRPSDLASLDSSATGKRNFIAFLRELPAGQEGVRAWRFFGSRTDEAKALTGLVIKEVGLTKIGIFCPNDAYGREMAELFAAEVAKAGGSLVIQNNYDPQNPQGYELAVKDFLKAGAVAGMEAVFLPDQWGRASQIVPYFSVHGGNSLVIMGPRLWSEALIRPGLKLDVRHFRLAVCPGAWWPGINTKGSQYLRAALAEVGGGDPDYWTSLGFDFARLAYSLNLSANDTPADINRLLSSTADKLFWSAAPMRYTSQGQVSQALFLLRPSVEGLAPIDAESLRDRLQTIRGSGVN